MKKQYQNINSVTLHLFFITAIIITLLSSFLLTFLYGKLDHPSLIDASIVVPWTRKALQPEPQERFVFLTLALMIPIISFLTGLVVFRGINKRHNAARKCMNLSAPIGLLRDHVGVNQRQITMAECLAGIPVLATTVLLYFPFIGYNFSRALVTNHRLPSEQPERVLMMTLLFAIGWCLWKYSRIGHFNTVRLARVGVMVSWVILGITVLLQICAWRIRSELSMTQAWDWYAHADGIFYPVSQVMAGKTLLVDLPSMYGLFPEFLRPVFKLTGFSIFKFTALCAILQMLSLGSVYWVVHCCVRDSMIRIASGFVLIMVTFGTVVWLIGMPDPYYQYWPIRFFWPAVAILFFYHYSNKPTSWRALAVSMVGVIGTLWNMDSGLTIVVAFAGVLVAKWVVLWSADRHAYRNARRQIRNVLLGHAVTFVIAGFSMFVYLFMKVDGPIHWDWLVGSQQLLYGLGLYMLPMPLYPSPWMSLLGIYLIALIVAVRSWAVNPHAKHADLLSFLSLLGLGLFVYYQGRSHHLNLIAVCWPSLVLIALLADRVLSAVRAGVLSKQYLILPIAGLSVLFFCGFPLLLSLDKLGRQIMTTYEHRNIPADDVVNDELSFIRGHSTPGDKCVILSLRQGLYFAAAGLVSPISGPGLAEMFLKSDRDALLDKLVQNRYPCIFVGSGSSAVPALGIDPRMILQDYDVAASNQYDTMSYLRPRQQSCMGQT